MSFQYLAKWDPDCLMTGTYRDLPLGHAIIEREDDITRFAIYLQIALKYHPQYLGIVFQ